RLKTLRGFTPYEYVARIWTEDPARFKIDPYRLSSGLNT
ncbi:MAG: IS481 family transposase, partial [Sphingomonas sp.]|nr:IS481 family transposase [Sphingomonas sp.]MBO9714882.1 IS481 family transposase [Sphingomonas sp.]